MHRIMAAPDGAVLGIDGRSRRLSQFTRDRITLLGFVYTTCVDPDGCPLAYRVFDAMKAAIEATPALRDKVRFVTLSFDPARDTPVIMRRYAGSRVRDEGRGLRCSCRWSKASARTSATRSTGRTGSRGGSSRTCSSCS
ncbi:MAG: hypothetical protein DME11_01890 [Candidatus Rokuibacteriota bacterium]|nr:MAG: hypothetical protein DME11_01890 [Candidatus Rokubacteria bacterium]